MSSYILKTIIISASATLFLVTPYTYAENITGIENNKWLPNGTPSLSSNMSPLLQNSTDSSTENSHSSHTNGNGSLSFNPIFMNTSQGDIDISRFDKENTFLPGTWNVEIYVNSQFMARTPVTFKDMENGQVSPCLTKDIIDLIGFKNDKITPLLKSALELHECIALTDFVPSTEVNYDHSVQRLTINTPQALVGYKPRGYVNPSLWERGINALLVSYNANYFMSRSNGTNYKSAFVGVNSNLNLGTWSFHHTGNYS
ncbi:FimD/PapC N-terminal domain-containing protein [Proteus cibi]|nr:FimD/PapC N-terminal domain-containing protein [Proteus cibi]